jgi:hypothetical protein
MKQHLEKEYIKTKERLGKLKDPKHIEAANRTLDRIIKQLEK